MCQDGHAQWASRGGAQGNWEGGQVSQGRDVPSDEMPTGSELPSSQNEQVRERKKAVRQVVR